jgi:two-component system CheB/CheR fusion protein
VEELAARIVARSAGAPRDARPEVNLHVDSQSAIEQVVHLLRSHTGHDFSQYKRSTVYRRIERRREVHKIPDIAGYVRHLQENPQEIQLLFKELLIGVTSFFRDPDLWEHLKDKVLPRLLAERPQGGRLRAWVAGCSTGEEAYSLAMVFKEAVENARTSQRFSLQIFATDLDRDAIDRARLGQFPAGISTQVSRQRLKRFFVEGTGGYRVNQEIRETVIFATQNVIMDPPFTKLDFVSCRNLLIYLSLELQKKLVPLFHYSLNPGGILILGSAETLGSSSNLFDQRDAKMRTFRRPVAAPPSPAVEFPIVSQGGRLRTDETSPVAKTYPPNLQALAERFLIERCSPPAVLTNDQGDILYVSGRTGKYLEPAAGKANWNVHAMAREGLRYELAEAFRNAVNSQRAVSKSSVKAGSHGAAQWVKVTVEPLGQSESVRGMLMILFSEAPAPPVSGSKGKVKQTPVEVAKLAQELRHAHEEVRTTHEEMQTSQEELKSTNEELQSTNEELQSTNEELTTSKEEMQSMNEELQTLNNELQAKVDELSHANDDLRNLLDSTDIGTLFLDIHLKVRRFTTRMTKIVNLIPGDIGRPITDLALGLTYPALADDARAVLETLTFKEQQIKTLDGRWFGVRIMPYRTTDNRIDGIVITFTDITASKVLEASSRREQVNRTA